MVKCAKHYQLVNQKHKYHTERSTESKTLPPAHTGCFEFLHCFWQRRCLDDGVVGLPREQFPHCIAGKFLLHLIADVHHFDEVFHEPVPNYRLATSRVLAECADCTHLFADVEREAQPGHRETDDSRVIISVHQGYAHQPHEFSGHTRRHVEVVQLAVQRDVDVQQKGEQNDCRFVLRRIAVVSENLLGAVAA